jgi:hypothetical protein
LLPIQIHTVPACQCYDMYVKDIQKQFLQTHTTHRAPEIHFCIYCFFQALELTLQLGSYVISLSHVPTVWWLDFRTCLNWCCCGFAAAHNVLTTPVAQVRDQLIAQCVTILYTYRKFCATASSSGQLILPEALKLLPLYTMGMLAIPPLHGTHDHWHRFWKCSLCKSHKVVTGLLSSYLQIVVVEISLQIS